MSLLPWHAKGRAQRWVTNGRSVRRCRCWQKPDAGQSPHAVNRRSASGQMSKYVVFLNSVLDGMETCPRDHVTALDQSEFYVVEPAFMHYWRRTAEFNQTLHNVWPSAALVYCIYIFGGSCPVTEFCQVQYALCVQSYVLAALLHGTGDVGVSQTLRHGTRNGIMELSLFIIFHRRRHLYFEGGHQVWRKPSF